jgi:hypothetical protein
MTQPDEGRVGFKFKCLLYDNEYFLFIFYCPGLINIGRGVGFKFNFVIWQWILFINFFIDCASLTLGREVGFKFKCLFYDNDYYMILFIIIFLLPYASSTNIGCIFFTQPRAYTSPKAHGGGVDFKFKCLFYDSLYFLLNFLLPLPHKHQREGLVSNSNVYYMTMNTFY